MEKKQTPCMLYFPFRFPIVDEKAPREADFDHMKDVLREHLTKDTACVFNCQVRSS